MAEYDFDRSEHIYRTWPMDEFLDSFMHKLRTIALESFRHDVEIWATIAPYTKKGLKYPEIPKILED